MFYHNVFYSPCARSDRRQMRISKAVSIVVAILLISAAILVPSAYAGPYRYYDVVMSDFKALADSYPDLVKFETVGSTVQGKAIIMVKIGNPSCDSILLDGAIHGWETLGSELLCFLAKWLLTSHDPLTNQILARSYILMIPGVDVDKFNIGRTNFNGVDLNRNFATNWNYGGSSDPTSVNYRGSAPLSEPESQALVRVFEKYRPKFYMNLHFGPGGAQYYFGSSYGNRTYYSTLTSRIRSLCQQRGVVPYPYSGESRASGFAISDAARVGITSFLVELMDQIIPISDIESVVLPRFIPMVVILSQECGNFKDDFETGDFSRWTGTYKSQGETNSVTTEAAYSNLYSAKFSSDGSSLFEASYCYETLTSLSNLEASAFFKVTSSGIASDDARFYLIALTVAGDTIAYVGWRQVASVIKWNLLVKTESGWVSRYSTLSPIVNRWYSVRLKWYKDSINWRAELYVDGISSCSIENINTTTLYQIDIRFGLSELYNCRSTTVYCDSSAVDALSYSPSTSRGDINRDGSVDLYDALIFSASYGSVLGDKTWNPEADFNIDNRVDVFDVLILARALRTQL